MESAYKRSTDSNLAETYSDCGNCSFPNLPNTYSAFQSTSVNFVEIPHFLEANSLIS